MPRDSSRRAAASAAAPASRDGDAAASGLSALLAELARGEAGVAPDAWERALRPGARIGRFELVRELGRGGFGVVWEARDTELGRSVAFKAVAASGAAGVREERLLREAEAAARLSHPNIVTLHDVGRCEHGPYLVLELLRGRPLAARLAEGPLPLREALRIAAEVACGVAHAHEQGVVHRDLTPANVLLCDDGRVKVLDFGMAHAFGRRRLDGGTPAYMAPEQWRGAPEDERTDVFALGVMIYRMVAGELPFPDDGGKAVTGSRPAPRLEVPEAPALGALVARTLTKDPVDRPRHAGEVATALAAFRAELERTPSTPGVPPRPRVTRERAARAILVGAAALATIAAVAVGAVLAGRHRAPEAGANAAAGAPRLTIAVADFENLTGEPELSGLSGMLITSLEQSRRLSVMTRVRMIDVLRQLGKDGVAQVDEALGREVARSAGARALVLATLRRFDQLYAIELKVLDPATSEYLFTLEERGKGKGSIPGMLDRLSEATRQRLRESADEVSASRVSVAAATTGSLEAYGHYFRGEAEMDATRYPEALAEYRKAIQADPTFALAHYRVAYLGEFTGLDASTRRAEIEAALEHVDRIPEKERLLVLAWKAHMDGRDDEARATYARAVAAYPEDKAVLYQAADHLFHRDELAEALPLFERALSLDPVWEPALMHVMDALGRLGRVEEMATRARAWAAVAPTGSAFRALAQASALAGDFEGAVREAQRAVEADGRTVFSRLTLASALEHADRYREAEEVARALLAEKIAPFHRARATVELASALAYQGKRREAGRLLAELKIPFRPPEPSPLLVHLLGDADLGPARAEARRLVEAGSRWDGLPTALALVGDVEAAEAQLRLVALAPARAVTQAVLAQRRGDVDGALAALRPVLDARDPRTALPSLWAAGSIAFAAGRDREAVDLLRRMQRAPGDVARSWMYPRSLYLEAAALERLGERARARERVGYLLTLWRDADPDGPLLREARALRARLEGGSPASSAQGAAKRRKG